MAFLNHKTTDDFIYLCFNHPSILIQLAEMNSAHSAWPILVRCEPLQCKAVAEVPEHQLFELLDHNDACVAPREWRLFQKLACELPCTRHKLVAREDLTDHSKVKRLLCR